MVSESGASREDGEATPQTFIEGMNSRARGGLEPEYETVGFHDMLYAKDMQILFFQPGHVVFTVPVAARLTNRYQTMHGGVIASLVDLSGTLASLSLIGPSRSMVTTDMNISYIAAAPADREVEVEAKLLQQGETVTVSVDLRDITSRKFVAQGRISMRLSSHPLSKL